MRKTESKNDPALILKQQTIIYIATHLYLVSRILF